MDLLTRPSVPPQEVEALIREARRLRHRRWLTGASAVSVLAAVALGAALLVAMTGDAGIAHPPQSAPPATSSPTTLLRSAPKCTSAQVQLVHRGSLVGAGNVNQLFWIRDVSDLPCSIRGYPGVAFLDLRNPYRPAVARSYGIQVGYATVRTRGDEGNDVGGLARGRHLPTAVLAADGGVASFWIAGTDITVGSPPYRCFESARIRITIPGSARATDLAGFFTFCGAIAVHPVVPGGSGAYPPKPLLAAAR